MMIQRVSSQRYYQTMGNDTGRMPAAANDGSVGSTAGGSPDAAAPYATPSFAHGIVPFDHEISSNQHLTFSYAEQSFASANIPWDPDHDALREALVNAVLHRDYAFPGPTLVNIFPSRVEIVSLGGLMDGIEINDLLNGISQPRNPRLAELFTRLGFSENYGTGIRRIMEEYDEASDNPQIRVGTSSVVMVLPLPSQPSPGGSRTRGDATKGGSAQGADGHDAAQGHAKMYAFPTIMTTATSDPTVALAGTRVIGCVPVRLSDGSALRTSPLIAPGRIASPAATAQLPPNAGQTLEEVTPALHRTGRRAVEPPADSRQSRRDQEPDDVRAASSGRAGSGPQTRQIPGHALQHALTRAPAETPHRKFNFRSSALQPQAVIPSTRHSSLKTGSETRR